MKTKLLLVDQALKTVVEHHELPKLQNKIIRLKRKSKERKRKIEKYKENLADEDQHIKSCTICGDLGSVYDDAFGKCNGCDEFCSMYDKILCSKCSNYCESCSEIYCEDCTEKNLIEIKDYHHANLGGGVYWFDIYMCKKCGNYDESYDESYDEENKKE